MAWVPSRATQIQTVTLNTPLSPSPVLAQLRLDLAVLQKPGMPVSPAAFANISAILQVPSVALAAAGPAAVTAASGGAQVKAQTDALARVELAQQVLGKFDADTFAKLPSGEQQLALDALWDNWTAKGLVGSPKSKSEPLAAFDAAISDGVNDKKLTAANKSIFLGAGVLGYPLSDSVWLAHTRIRDAIDDNMLRYPANQKWHTADGTPEFLGTTKEGQETLDAWGRAVDYSRLILKQVEAGSKNLPKSAEIPPEAAAGFARLAAELKAKGDAEALAYLRDQDPTFVAFLLDARKPGYYLYNGSDSIVARIMATKAAGALGIRRLDQKDGAVHASTYFYRPKRVAERAAAVSAGEASSDAASYRDAMKPYAARLAALASKLPAGSGSAQGFGFVEAQFLDASALESAANKLETYGAKQGFSRYDLPITAGTVRGRRGQGYGALSDAQWRGLVALHDASPLLKAAAEDTPLRVVSQAYETRGQLIAKNKTGGLTVQLFVLDRLAELESDPAARGSFLRFLAAAAAGALAP
jgi:hypothetical protein